MYIANIPLDGGTVPTQGREIGFAPDLGGLLSAAPGTDVPLPCRTEDADLWFAERPDELSRAQRLCRECPIRQQCLNAALSRREPWGVWGGEIFERGRVIPFKRGRGRPAKIKATYRESTVA